jgi:hypothetical protein
MCIRDTTWTYVADGGEAYGPALGLLRHPSTEDPATREQAWAETLAEWRGLSDAELRDRAARLDAARRAGQPEVPDA